MSRRAWCRESGSPRSREASESNPRHQPGVIFRFYLMHTSATRMRASGKHSDVKIGRAVWFKAGERWTRSIANPPAGFGPKPHMANRVQSSTGSINARWRRESGGGNTDRPESDTFRGFAETRRTMKSSTMKGASSPCQ